MSKSEIRVSMTNFGAFCVTDPLGQASKVLEIRRRYETPYRPSSDFWSRWREGVEAIHRRGGTRDQLAEISSEAKDNRGDQYESAVAGYRRFWGRKTIEFIGTPSPANWTHDRLTVRINPEWLVRINGDLTIVKLHLTERQELNQRLANPLLHLLAADFENEGRSVAILDVHRGKLWRPTVKSRRLGDVLKMQAAAFIVGWDSVPALRQSA